MKPQDASGARGLRWVPADALAAIRKRLTEVWSRWTEDWSPGLGTLPLSTVDSRACIGERELAWRPLLDASVPEDAQAWVGTSDRAADELERHWFGAGAARGLAADAARQALLALHDGLRVALTTAHSPSEAMQMSLGGQPSLRTAIPATHGCAWSGALTFGWQIAGAAIRLHIGPDLVAKFDTRVQSGSAASPSGGLVPLPVAARDLRIRLRAELVGVQLSLGELASLRTGDALRLEHRLDAPLTVVSAAGESICAAVLGEHSGRRALRLLPAPEGLSAAMLRNAGHSNSNMRIEQ